AQHVAVQRLAGRQPGGWHVALGSEVEDPVRAGLAQRAPDGDRVADIALDPAHAGSEVLDVLEPAPPPERAEHLDVATSDKAAGQVPPHHPGEAGDRAAHQRSPSKKLRMGAMTASISSDRSSGKHGSESTSRAAAHAAGNASAW